VTFGVPNEFFWNTGLLNSSALPVAIWLSRCDSENTTLHRTTRCSKTYVQD